MNADDASAALDLSVDPSTGVKARTSALAASIGGLILGKLTASWGSRAADLLQGAEEPAPEHFVFGVADIETVDLPATVGGDRGRDDDGHGGDLPAPTAPTGPPGPVRRAWR